MSTDKLSNVPVSKRKPSHPQHSGRSLHDHMKRQSKVVSQRSCKVSTSNVCIVCHTCVETFGYHLHLELEEDELGSVYRQCAS